MFADSLNCEKSLQPANAAINRQHSDNNLIVRFIGYSMTSLIMRWLEEVFEHGWVYGSKEHALGGKKIIVGITVRSTNDDYADGGKMGISVDEILKPYKKHSTFAE